MTYSFQNINEMQICLLEQLKTSGEVIIARNLKTIECTDVKVVLHNPLKRITTLGPRHWSLPFAIGELAWHLAGSNKLDFIEYYTKNWKSFSENGFEISNSCYGNKIFSSNSGVSQWNGLVNLFKTDPNTRRGVLNLYTSEHGLNNNLKDIACTCSIQFLLRNNRINTIVYMRSNDIIWGLPNDIFFFTFLQELLAVELNAGVGEYTHLVGSLHLYERHFDLADKIINTPDFVDFTMPSIDNINQLELFLLEENNIRNGVIKTFSDIHRISISDYWKNLLEILLAYSLGKKNLPYDINLNNPYSFLFKNNKRIIEKFKF